MAQPSRVPARPGRDHRSFSLVDLAIGLALVGVVYTIAVTAAHWTAPLTPSVDIDLQPRALPAYAGASVVRMAAAYLLALIFSLIYGRVAATHRAAERVMLPLLDILQSIPILSFMPGVVLALVALFPTTNLGLELAAVILIFTSQAWNLAFGVYQSLRTIPRELSEAAALYRLNAWRRFWKLELPASAISLVWNSMMSWAGGWFFLMAAEQFTLGEKDFRLPGLGSYLKAAVDAGDLHALGLGLATLVAVIVALDQLVWRPLVAWAEKFKVEQSGAAVQPTSWVLTLLRRSALVAWVGERLLPALTECIDRWVARWAPAGDTGPPAAKGVAWGPRLLGAGGLAAVSLIMAWGGWAGLRLLRELTLADWAALPPAAGATFLRVAAALAIGVLWTVPVGVAVGLHPRWAQRVQPLVQIAASIPATALFPVLLLVLLGLPGGLNLAAVALMLLGTQWYLLFNVIAGAQAIPTDLREAAEVYKLRGWRRWRYLILPSVFPYLVTGLITAAGGAWNASIVSEYVSFGGAHYQTLGLGAFIAQAADTGAYARLAAGTLTMALLVVALNRLVWRRLYALAERRYHLE
ncbi:MAG TPA: ABC transporter permease subunit [Chloroflexota bacterium]|nr:ABC transporter permease subunit [Chloroflexota bacterium]